MASVKLSFRQFYKKVSSVANFFFENEAVENHLNIIDFKNVTCRQNVFPVAASALPRNVITVAATMDKTEEGMQKYFKSGLAMIFQRWCLKK